MLNKSEIETFQIKSIAFYVLKGNIINYLIFW